MRLFACPVCSQTLFFENSRCLQCGHDVAYAAHLGVMVAVETESDDGTFELRPASPAGRRLRHCQHRLANQACNWAVDADETHVYCPSCQLTELIPDLTDEPARQAWIRAEVAKRRLLYTLDFLGLPLEKRTAGTRGTGLGFAFKMPGKEGEPVITGHASGLITLNLLEADDIVRTRNRIELGEAYRTLLGHFRHEVGHYYWDRLIRDSALLDQFRTLFGDERADYGEALKKHYEQGAPSDWSQRHVSPYATSHPWEDWAETWAHYLHLVDTLEIARSYGLTLRPTTEEAGVAQKLVLRRTGFSSFESMVQAWIPVTVALNSFSRGLGRNDLYPFALSPRVIEKLHFVHDVVQASECDSPLRKL